MPDLPWTPSDTYVVYGYLRYAGSAGATVTAVNRRTGETLSGVAESDGSFVLDMANFTSGYADRDTIDISAGGNRVVTSINSGLFLPDRRVDVVPLSGRPSSWRTRRRRRSR